MTTLLQSPAQILREWFTSESAPVFTLPAAAGAWPLFVGSLPDGNGVADNAACLYDTAGDKDGRLATGENLFKYGVQLRVRATTYAAGYAKANAALKLLEALHQELVTVDGTSYLIDIVVITSPVMTLGTDESTKRRESFTLNLLVMFTDL